MVDYLRRPVAHEAFFKKYASKKFLKGKMNLAAHALCNLLICCSIHFHPPVGQEVSLVVS